MHAVMKTHEPPMARSGAPIFVHSAVDDFGLTPAQFRLYGHIARRCGSGSAWPSIETMARVCRMDVKTVKKNLKVLVQLGLLRKEPRPGFTNFYSLTPLSEWKCENLAHSDSQGVDGLTSGVNTHPDILDQNSPHKGAPVEVTPVRKPRSKSSSRKPPSVITEELLQELERDPAYSGIDIRHVFAKMCRWCKTNRRHPTERRLINWLNNEDRHLATSTDKQKDPSLW